MKEKKVVRVVCAVIRKGNRVFATQRGYGDYKDGWEFPGGKIEEGETPEEALVREIREELDTLVRVGERIAVLEHDYPDFHLSMDCFWCGIEAGSPVLLEHEAARWLGPDTLDGVDWLPADRALIDRIRRALEEDEEGNF